MKKKKLFNERGAGGIAEVLIIILAAVLITGAVVLLLYNAISDKGNTVTQGIRGTGTTSPSDLDGDGLLNAFVLVGKASDGTKYWRMANPISDYGQPGAQLESSNTGGAYNDDDGDEQSNISEVVGVNSNVTQDNYYAKLGAKFKSNQPAGTLAASGGASVSASYSASSTGTIVMARDPQDPTK